jgi:formylglycine-generating enzyme required for sulfatase activity
MRGFRNSEIAHLRRALKTVQAQIAEQDKLRTKVGVDIDRVAREALQRQELAIAAQIQSVLSGLKDSAKGETTSQPDIYSPGNHSLDHDCERYLLHLLDRYRYLEFKGMGVVDRVPMKLALQDLYVPLRGYAELPIADISGPASTQTESDPRAGTLPRNASVVDIVQKSPGVVLLGDPGSGKTTVLKYLALCLATGRGDLVGLGALLPILVPLSAYATALEQVDVSLQHFLGQYFHERGLQIDLEGLVEDAMNRGLACVLLDGLDEVHDVAHRRVVVDRVVDLFTFYQRRGNKFIITSRIAGYKEIRPEIGGLGECTLLEFDDTEIGQFVEHWSIAIERAAHGDTLFAREASLQERQELIAAIRQSSGVRRMASNPLMLTILALLKRQGVALPDRRVELYEAAVAALVKYWNLARGLGRPPTKDLDVSETVRILGPLALWMHESRPGLGLVSQELVHERLANVYASKNHANADELAHQFLADVREYSGILVERAPDSYGFVHLGFQEYLAATAIVSFGQNDIQPIVEYLKSKLSESLWREVIRLAVAYMGVVQKRDEAATALIEQLADGASPRGLVVLGFAAADSLPGGVSFEAAERLASLLAANVLPCASDIVDRVDAGRVLAYLGDPRTGALITSEMPLCKVSAGRFVMGDGDQTYDSSLDEFWISKYPVTTAQFQEFVDDGGYREASYWSNAGWSWRLETKSDRPISLQEPFRCLNHPRVGVTWYEAMAYASWLERRYAITGWRLSLPNEPEWEKAARGGTELPVEIEERRLTELHQVVPQPPSGTIANPHRTRKYPWGDAFTTNYAATGFAGITSTVAVGCFPESASPYGVNDLIGNVWEWLRSAWGQDLWKPEFLYPYDASDGRETLDVGDDVLRIVRGGSYLAGGPQHSEDERHLSCSYRTRNAPDGRHLNHGFRIVAIPWGK